jgi:hypothetical protein
MGLGTLYILIFRRVLTKVSNIGSLIANYAEDKVENAFGDVAEEGGRIEGHVGYLGAL